MVGVTIHTEEDYWLELKDIAINNFVKCTGIKEVVAISCKTASEAIRTKFHILDDINDTVCYFEADLIYLRPWNPSIFQDTSSFITVQCIINEIVKKDSVLGYDPSDYFNAGFFIASYSSHKAQFKEADRLFAKLALEINCQHGDQHFLNIALRDTKKIFLDARYNDVGYGKFRPITSNTVGAHFAAWNKIEALKVIKDNHLIL